MNLQERIAAFAGLGCRIPGLPDPDLVEKTVKANNWFTNSEIIRAMHAWSALLNMDNLVRWTGAYRLPDEPPMRNVRVITAGNIPLVGFHDFLSVLISGNRFSGKLSSRDDILLTLLAGELVRLEPRFARQIDFQDIAGTAPEAVIATGSDNSARYFHQEFARIPHIIRKNRSSAAILDGTETPADLRKLSADILEYYGLGCRSVSHLFLPEGHSPENLVRTLASCHGISPCGPMADNLRYQRARLAMLEKPFLDAGRVLLTENPSLHSPIGVVHFSFYRDPAALLENLKSRDSELQCILGHKTAGPGLIPFGTAQQPALWDYADRVDTLDFLLGL
jgi:hypothetical protein